MGNEPFANETQVFLIWRNGSSQKDNKQGEEEEDAKGLAVRKQNENKRDAERCG